MTLVVFPPKDGKRGLTEEADSTQRREGVLKKNVRRQTIKHRSSRRNGPKLLYSITERLPVMDGFRKFSIDNRPP